MDVERQVTIAEPEPVRRPNLAELFECVPALASEPPAALAIAESGEGVEERVVIWANGEAMQFKVISRVGDDAQLTLRECTVETVGKLCAANPTSKECNTRAHAVRPGSTSRPKASAHST